MQKQALRLRRRMTDIKNSGKHNSKYKNNSNGSCDGLGLFAVRDF
jgi:hypothetical protein